MGSYSSLGKKPKTKWLSSDSHFVIYQMLKEASLIGSLINKAKIMATHLIIAVPTDNALKRLLI
jgi:hypothetical protein